MRSTSKLVVDAAQGILRLLRGADGGVTADQMRAFEPRASVSAVTVHRALGYLRTEHDAPLVFDRRSRRWRLTDPQFGLPLSDPTPEDFTAVVFAAALLAPLGDAGLQARIDRLIEQMDGAVRRGHRVPVRPSAVTATVSGSTPVDPRMLATLVRACAREVLRIRYAASWSGREHQHTIEPWQLRIHDGAMYLRAYSRRGRDARSYRVAQIVSVVLLEGERPNAKISAPIWGTTDPSAGIDDDRPGTAVVRIRGPLARWAAPTRWHAHQRDRWIIDGEMLERTVAYSSCRELARKLLFFGDALEAVEPAELRDEIVRHAGAVRDTLGPRP